MATLTSGDTLSLNGLASATGQSTKSLSAAKGNTTGPISLSSFAIDSVGQIQGFTYLVENTSEAFELQFSGAGSNFGRISTRSANFTWGVTGGSVITLSGAGSATQTFSVGNMNAEPTIVVNDNHTISATFADGFNDHASGYNTPRTKVIYSVDSYDGNAVDVCLTLDTPVELVDGTTVLAGDIEEGMKLKGRSIDGLEEFEGPRYIDWSSNSINGSDEEVEVISVVYSFTDKIYNINDGLVKCSSEHPFLVLQENGEYTFKRTHLLNETDILIKLEGGEYVETPITSIELIEEDTEIVSIDVDGSNIYIANGIVTHNKDQGNSHTDFDGPTAPTSVSYSHPSLSWSGGTADTNSTAGITAYDVQVDNNSDFSSPVINESNWNASSMQLAGGGIPAGTYYARVRNVQTGLKSGWTTTAAFSVVV
jgi:hypothetical protein